MKHICVFLVCLCLLLSGCQNTTTSEHWQPSITSANIEPYAEKALGIVEQYLAFEITLSEFSAGISEVYNRLDWDDCEENNSADTAVCSTISDLYFHYDEFNDNAFRMYRDILIFQLGGIAKDETYPPAKRINAFEEESKNLANRLKLQSFPASDVSIYAFEESSFPLVLITFDLANGVMPEDVFNYYKTLINYAKQEDVRIDSLTIFYHIYGQLAFAIDAISNESGTYTLSLDLDVGNITKKEYVESTDENINQMIIEASTYVSDYTK